MTPSERRSAITQAFRTPELEPALAELLVPADLVQARSACLRLSTMELIVAVLGMQGVGKSLLLNAIAGRRVLAVGEDETTNVIVRIRAADAGGERAEVRFADGRTERAPLTEDFVRRYTDELENPDNTAGVREVTCFLDAPLLRDGMVLADTPGVGSLRPANAEVTHDFLPGVSLGLFVIPTVPTLRKSEVQFLRATWRHSRDFIYVQNRWNAAPRELADALATNRRILTEVAQAEGDSRPVVVIDVDFGEALEGACNDQPERVAASGLPALVTALRGRLAGGPERLHLETNAGVLVHALRRAQGTAETRLGALAGAGEETDAAFAARIAEARDALVDTEARWTAARADFAARREALLESFSSEFSTALDQAHARLDAHIEARSIDVNRMNDVVAQELTEAARVPLTNLDSTWGEATRAFVAASTSLHDTVEGKARGFRFDSVEGRPMEVIGEGIYQIGKVGALTAVTWAAWAAGGALVAGEGAAAAVAAAGAAVPGVGWAVAAGALAIGFVCMRAGRKKVQAGMRTAVAEAITGARSEWTREATRRIERAAARLDQTLDAQVRADRAHDHAVLDQLAADHAQDRQAREETRVRMESHRHAIARVLAVLHAHLTVGTEQA